MKDQRDSWYVRLPDGRTIKAKSSASVRHHIEAGHIPLNSLARRRSSDEWLALPWLAEFADLVSGAAPRALSTAETAAPRPPDDRGSKSDINLRTGVSARLDPMRLQTVGVRGLIDELISALDSTLTRSKIVPALGAAILTYAAMFAARTAVGLVLEKTHWLGTAAGIAAGVAVIAVIAAFLSKLTHLELSTMRPASIRDGFQGSTSYVVNVLIAQAIVVGTAFALLFLVNKVPQWVFNALRDAEMNNTLFEVISTPVLIITALVSITLWIVIGLGWLLTPAIVVEELSFLGGIREWRQLIREHFGRILVYEGLATFLGLAVSLPITAAVALATGSGSLLVPTFPTAIGLDGNWVTGLVDSAIHGLTAGPLLATLAVSNVFIYLNLRYEQSDGR